MVAHPDVLAYDRDRVLVCAFQDGDSGALAELVYEHYPRLMARARRRTPSEQDAEDAVQETFLRAYRALPNFGGEYMVGAWLGRILANVCTDMGSRRQHEREMAERLAGQGDVQPGGPDDHVEERRADAECIRRALTEALASLPDSYREAFLLREIDDRPYAEVAKVMQISEVNARARVHRARVALKRSLQATSALLSAVLTPVRLFRYLPAVISRHGKPGAGLPFSLPSSSLGASSGSSLASATVQSLVTQAAASPAAQVVVSAVPAVNQVVAPAASVLATTLAVASAALVAPLVAAAPTTPRPAVVAAGALPGPVAPVAMQTTAPAAAAVVPTTAATNPGSPPTAASATAATSTPPSAPAGPNWPWMSTATGQQQSAAADQSGTADAPSASGGSAPSSTGDPSASTGALAAPAATPQPVACPWLQSFPDATPSSVAMPPPVLDSGSAALFFSSGTVELNTAGPSFVAATTGSATAADGSTSIMSVLFGTCLPGMYAPALVVNLSEPGGAEWQLRGALVSSTTAGGTTDVLYRGVGIPVGQLGTVTDPVPFVARVEVEEPANLASLQVAVYGAMAGLVPAGSTTATSGQRASTPG